MKNFPVFLVLVLLLSALSAGCSFTPLIEPELGEQFDLPLGRDAVILGEDLRLTFEEVVSDSRCPLAVECVTAGEAVYTVTAKKGDDTDLVTFTEMGLGGQGEAEIYGYHIEAMLQPYPNRPEDIGQDEYELRLTVTRAEQ